MQYFWLLHFLNIQFLFTGNSGKEIRIEKGFLSGIKNFFGNFRNKFFGSMIRTPEFDNSYIDITIDRNIDYSKYRQNLKRLDFPDGSIVRENLEQADQEIFDFLSQDWNKIYLEHRDKASILGYLAEYMIGKGVPDEELSEMSLPEFSSYYSENFDSPGLDEINKISEVTGLDKDKVYGYLYAESKGAEWLAIYDENGNRSGKSYELITKMYRKQIAEAMLRNATVSDIRSIMVSPDDDEIREALGLFDDNLSKEEREIKESEFQELIKEHLNRDMQRFAYTETMINYNNGKLLRLAQESNGEPVYVTFSRT